MPWFSSERAAPIERRDIPLTLETRASMVQVASQSSFVFGSGGPSFMLRNPAAFANEGYCRNVVAFACVHLIAQAAASVELQLEQGPKAEIVDAHPLLDLFARPNSLLSGPEFMEAMIAHRLIPTSLDQQTSFVIVKK